ncbi:9019_t:CDS:2, partial [Cetraspora pellucida]
MSLVDTIPPIIVVAVSSISLILQIICNRTKYFEIPSDETGLFTFLFCWRFKHGNDINHDTI